MKKVTFEVTFDGGYNELTPPPDAHLTAFTNSFAESGFVYNS